MATDPVIANIDTGTTDEDTLLTVNAISGVLANDSGTGLTVSEVNGVAADVGNTIILSSGASLTLNSDGSYSYDPTAVASFETIPAGTTVTDSFTYTAFDGTNSSSATVNITVTVNDPPPTATDGSTTTDENHTVNGKVAFAPAVDHSDANSDGATVTAGTFTSADGAAVTIAADGSFTYDPTAVASF